MCILLLSDHHMSNIMTHNQHLLDSCILTEQATLGCTTLQFQPFSCKLASLKSKLYFFYEAHDKCSSSNLVYPMRTLKR